MLLLNQGLRLLTGMNAKMVCLLLQQNCSCCNRGSEVEILNNAEENIVGISKCELIKM